MEFSYNTPIKDTAGMKEDVQEPEAAVTRRWGICPKVALPPKYRNEMVQLFSLAGPVVLSQTMVFMISFVSMVFCGHLGKTELAGVSLAIAVVNVTGVSIGFGLSLTCDTLISQTYGSGNLRRVGVILQRAILIMLLACFPCWAVLINTEPLLLAVKQSPDVASLSQIYVKVFMPALPATFMYQLQSRYLQNQRIIWPQVISGAVGNVLNAVINYIFLFSLDLGVAGSAAANAISQYVLAVVLYMYIYCRGLYKATWGGWSLDCLQEWGLFVQLAVPSMLMICLEWWLFEVGGLLAGLVSEVELGAQSIIYQLTVMGYMFPLGISAAASVRVGNALGAGNLEQAKLSCKVPIFCASTASQVWSVLVLKSYCPGCFPALTASDWLNTSDPVIISCIVGTSFTMARHDIGYIFTKEQDIIHRVADVMIVFGFMHVADGIAGVTGGILRGAGKPLVGALCNFMGYYLIGFPIGVSLMFAVNMGILGLWIGLAISVILQSSFFIAYLCKLDWKKAAEEASVRAGIKRKKQNELEMENMDSKQKQEPGTTTESTHETEVQNISTTTVGDVLSVSQLIFRRGLTCLLMVIILVTGILLSDFFIRLLK